MTKLKIREPVQPIEAMVKKHHEDGTMEVQFPPSWNYNSGVLTLVGDLSSADVPIGSKVIVDSAVVGNGIKGMATIRAYSLDGRIIADNFPGQKYKRSEPVIF